MPTTNWFHTDFTLGSNASPVGVIYAAVLKQRRPFFQLGWAEVLSMYLASSLRILRQITYLINSDETLT